MWLRQAGSFFTPQRLTQLDQGLPNHAVETFQCAFKLLAGRFKRLEGVARHHPYILGLLHFKALYLSRLDEVPVTKQTSIHAHYFEKETQLVFRSSFKGNVAFFQSLPGKSDVRQWLLSCLILTAMCRYLAPAAANVFRDRYCIDGGMTLFMPPTAGKETVSR